VSLGGLAALACLTPHCATNWVDAVVTSSQDDGGAISWPNAISSGNSDPWLVANHDRIVQMQPKVLVLHFYNGTTVDQTRQIAEAQIAAIAEGSRFHGYSDATAPPFLSYQLVGVVDLADHPPPAGWPYPSSTALPVDASGAFDPTKLYTQAFATYYGFPDPNQPSRDLTLCELFESGTINELWLEVGESGARAPGLMMESKQVYDSNLQPIRGMFNACTGYACLSAAACKVTVRIAHLSPALSPGGDPTATGCDLLTRTTGIENTGKATDGQEVIPYLEANDVDYFNDDFRTEDGTTFNSWYELCTYQGDAQAPCVTYPSATVAQGTYMDGTSWRMDPFVQGCGTSHFPANARFAWDYTNTQPVQSRCEHYRMLDGPDGNDLPDEYTSTKVAANDQAFGSNCSAGWQIYLRQNIPGLGNKARAVDGTPMKNWWPFLFY
jgi:hypothetical protein